MKNILNWMLAATLVCGATAMTACSSSDDNQAQGGGQEYTGVPLVILDTDIGSSTDDLFVLEMLCRYDDEGRCRLLGVVVDREGEDCAACADVMNTYFGHGDEPDYNFLQGMDFANTLFRLWPKDVDIVFSPMEAGNGIEYLPEQVIADVSWTDRHPIKQVYLRCNCNTGQMMWDPLTVIQAVEGDRLFTLTDRGTVVLRDDGTVIFTPSATGNSRFQMPGDAAWRSAMLEKIRNCNKTNYNS